MIRMSENGMTLRGHTALVTGSTDGLGRAVAERLGREGAHVLLHGRDRSRGHQVRKTVEAVGGTATFYQADLGSFAEVRRLAEAVGQHERVELLINNAG